MRRRTSSIVCLQCISWYFLHLIAATEAFQWPVSLQASLEHPILEILRPRSRLKPEHKHLFEDDEDESSFFHPLGRVVCTAGVVSRKEFLETYAAATYIHSRFPHQRRMADLAAGHGLLAWFLLAMDPSSRRTVVCVDRRMPPAAHAIRAAFLDQYPEWQGKWSYVQSELSAMEPHHSCLLTSVHGCGTLTDQLIEMALESGAPLALVPCCHTVQNGYTPHSLSGTTAEQVAKWVEQQKEQADNKHDAVANVVDQVRCLTLEKGGYQVEEILLPVSFTKRNRLLVAKPRLATKNNGTLPTFPRQRIAQPTRTGMPPLETIPLRDDPESIAVCQSIAQPSTNALTTIPKQMATRHVSLTLAMAIWLPDDQTTAEQLQTKLQTFSNRQLQEDHAIDIGSTIRCSVQTCGTQQHDQNRSWQLYKFQYTQRDGNNIRNSSRGPIKTFHKNLRGGIDQEFGGIVR